MTRKPYFISIEFDARRADLLAAAVRERRTAGLAPRRSPRGTVLLGMAAAFNAVSARFGHPVRPATAGASGAG